MASKKNTPKKQAARKEDEQRSDPTSTATRPTATGKAVAAGASDPAARKVNTSGAPSPCAGTAAASTVPTAARSTVKSTASSGLAAKLRESAAGKTAPAKAVPPHLIVEARAGTGKTTTIIEGLRVMRGLPTTITPSEQQAAVWAQMALSRDARTVCLVAFNKSIATELQRRVPPGCEAMTMHSMGFRAVLAAFPQLRGRKLNEYRSEHVALELLGIRHPGPAATPAERDAFFDARRARAVVLRATSELVSLCKLNLVADPDDAKLDELARYYDVQLTEEKGGHRYGKGIADVTGPGKDYRAEVFDLVPRVLKLSRDPEQGGMIDFDDMIWLPVVLGLPMTKYDLLVGDEVQDWNRCQQALAKRAGDRLVLVGDPKQAIYGFAGADSESMKRMQVELGSAVEATADDGGRFTPKTRGCVVLPLTVTRRCGRAIVARANEVVADFQAHESNPDGEVLNALYPTKKDADGVPQDLPEDKTYLPLVQPGDMVLCRVNAPLVSQCFKFIRSGRRANIQGRDVAKGLTALVKKLWADGLDVIGFLQALDAWLTRERSAEAAKTNPCESKLIGLQDRYDCLCCFAEDAVSCAETVARIEALFTDDRSGPGIRLSSIHRAKGLEAKRVFFLMPEGGECPHPMARSAWQREQEQNLLYVGITRAIETLYFVS